METEGEEATHGAQIMAIEEVEGEGNALRITIITTLVTITVRVPVVILLVP